MDEIRTLTDDGYIVSNTNVLGGTACIQGTRLSVYAIAARLDGDETAADIVAENPWVTLEMVLAAVDYARRVPLVEHPDGRPWRKKAKAGSAV